MTSTLLNAVVSGWLFTVLITFTAANSFAKGGLEQVSKDPVVVYGFLKKSGTKAVVSTDRKTYTLDWMEFARVNSFAKEHETRQAAYKIPTTGNVEIKPIADSKQKER